MNSENSLKDYIPNIINEQGISTKDLLDYIVQDSLSNFNELIKWTDEDYKTYNSMLEKAQNIDNSLTTKEIGDLLEDLVCFIIRKTYFFEVVKNVRTKTNEIDQYISLSKKGIQALKLFSLDKKLLVLPVDGFLGECKNYKENINVTWIGKFYGLLKTCNCDFGIIFSLKKLTGSFNNWSDAYGLLRSIVLIEKYESKKNFYIIDFGINEFNSIKEGISFFDIVKSKIEAIKLGTSYEKILEKYKDMVDEDKSEFIKSVEDIT